MQQNWALKDLRAAIKSFKIVDLPVYWSLPLSATSAIGQFLNRNERFISSFIDSINVIFICFMFILENWRMFVSFITAIFMNDDKILSS